MPQRIILSLALLISLHDIAIAQWGTLRGRVIVKGEVPRLPPLVKGPVRGIPAAAVVLDDSLVIDPQTQGLANVAVWLAKKPAEIHPEFEFTQPLPLQVEMTGTRFHPHMLIVCTHQPVNFFTRDGVAYNPRSSPLKNIQHGLIVAPNGQPNPLQFRVAERLPVPIHCDIHAWMRGYWLVLDHPYAAITDTDGYFHIPNLPVGEHEFKVWHERPGYLVRNAADPKKGLIVRIEEGEPTAVPDIRVPVKKLTEPRK